MVTAAYDPTGPLSVGLQSLLLFDSIGVSSTVGVAWMWDYASPTQTFIFGGTAANITIGHAAPCGGQSINETGTGTGSDFLQYQAPLAATTTWSMSALVNFDGLAHASGNLIFFADHFAASPIQVSTVNHQLVFNGGASIFGPDVTTLNGWYRVHITSDGTTSRAYINGVANGSPSSVAAVLSVPLGMVTLDWPWPVADFFWWQNRTLSAAEVMVHYADPYGTTMMPRISTARVGSVQTLIISGGNSALWWG